MKRDWDVIRDVLIEVEGLGDLERNTRSYGVVTANSPADALKSQHAMLLLDAGYLSGTDFNMDGVRGLVGPNLTWQGHDLLDTLRSKPVWEKIKMTARDKGIELTFEAVKALGKLALQSVLAS